MNHTHYGYDENEQSKKITHDHACRKPDDHSHPTEFLAIFWDEEGEGSVALKQRPENESHYY